MTHKQASFMCNQVLKVVKESRLNYLMNETPYSAHITIRKKFVKHADIDDTFAVDDFALSDVALRQENITLRQKLKDFASENGVLKLELEKLELNMEEMAGKNKTLEEKTVQLESEKSSTIISLEVSKGQVSQLYDKLAKQVDKEKELCTKVKDTTAENKSIEKIMKEKDDELVMLEFTLQNRDAEIERLRTKLTKYPCDECEFKTENESDLKSHIGQLHIHTCENCNLTFEGYNKLKNHTCRIKIENPTSYWFYTKDWFEHGKFIRVFDNQLKEEVVVIHGEDCIHNNACILFPENFKKEKYFKDTNKILHLTKSYYMTSNKIKWEELWGMKNIIIDQGYTRAVSK